MSHLACIDPRVYVEMPMPSDTQLALPYALVGLRLDPADNSLLCQEPTHHCQSLPYNALCSWNRLALVVLLQLRLVSLRTG